MLDIEQILNLVGESDDPESMLDAEELGLYQQHVDANEIPALSHYDNLLPMLDNAERDKLAKQVCEWVQWDEKSRADWSKREAEGIRTLGLSDKIIGKAAFEGASTVTHPLLTEAITNFHARAMAEIWPPEGPVKAIVLGDKTPERLAQAQRVEDYMNYQYTELMPGAFDEEDTLLFRLPISGSVFKKVYYDPLHQQVCSRMVEPSDFIVPFSAVDLATAQRYTHRYRETRNTVIKKIASGYYDKIDLVLNGSSNDGNDYPVVLDEIDSIEGKERTSAVNDDNLHTLYETYVELDFESADGIALPYIVWVDRDSQQLLRIQRNWKQDDELKQPHQFFAHYKFMPGLGFYGYGLFHLIGGMAQSATGTLRSLLDSAAFNNLQGGYRTRDSRMKGGDVPIAPGEWREVDSSAEELAKAFFPLPYKEPSKTLFELLGYIDERGQKFIGTTDVMTGDANPNAPVGTTMAMIEQGSKVFSAIHRRLHQAHRDEFRILARLNAEYIPEAGYPYFTSIGDRMILPFDFDDRVDVIPVSDPSIISSTQRIVQAQAILDLAEKHPDQVSLTEAIKKMLETIRVADTETLMTANSEMQQAQNQMAQLDIRIKQAQLDKLTAEKEKVDAEKTESVIRGMFASIQAAGLVAQQPIVADIANTLFMSAGGKDYNGSPLFDQLSGIQPQSVEPLPVQQNTSPGFPAKPDTGMSHSHYGLETMANEGLISE